MVYAWKTASQIRADPQAAGAVCEQLESRGSLTAKALLEVSRSPAAPLHGEFEWNDGIAAERYRENQARHIINCLITAPQKNAAPVRAFFQIEQTGNQYTSLSAIVHAPDKYQALMDQAKRELQAFTQKYHSLHELQPVFDAINHMTA